MITDEYIDTLSHAARERFFRRENKLNALAREVEKMRREHDREQQRLYPILFTIHRIKRLVWKFQNSRLGRYLRYGRKLGYRI